MVNYLSALLDLSKVAHTYAEVISTKYPNLVGGYAGFGLNVTKLGLALNDIALKQAAGKEITLGEITAPLLAVTDIVSDLAVASPIPQLRAGGLIAKAASLVANIALQGLGDKVVIPAAASSSSSSIEVTNQSNGDVIVVGIGNNGGKTNINLTNRLDFGGSGSNNVFNETIETTTLGGAPDAGMYTATEVTNTRTGETHYIIRENATGENIASGNNYVVNANNTITVTSGTANFTHGLSDGRLRVMQSTDGSGLVVGQEGDDFFFDAGSTVQINSDGSISVLQTDGKTYWVRYGQSVQITSDTNRDNVVDWIQNTDYLNDNTAHTTQDNNADGTIDAETLTLDNSSYDLYDFDDRSAAEYRLSESNQRGELRSGAWDLFTSNTSIRLLDRETGAGLWIGGGEGLQLPANWLNPIGAFYDSQSAAYDNAASIAHKTTRAMNANGQAMSAQQLGALDVNGDGQISAAEGANLRLWADGNEDGRIDSGELLGVGAEIKSADYGFYTRGNGQVAPTVVGSPTAPNQAEPALARISSPSLAASAYTLSNSILPPINPGTPFSNYRTLRDTDNRFFYAAAGGSIGWIDFTASMVKINFNNQSYLIGTDGADAFDSSYYAAYPQWFNINLLTNFLAGGGNDLMGGSVRNDRLWGGLGNDTLLGYAGDDGVDGEEGNDTLNAADGPDCGLSNVLIVCSNSASQQWASNAGDWRQAA